MTGTRVRRGARWPELVPAVRCAAIVTLLLAASAVAQPVAGTGRVTVSGGWRYTPNAAFNTAALQRGLVAEGSIGGPLVTGTFAYAATEYAEVSIDLFAAGERLHFAGHNPFTSLTYGGWLGGRLQLVIPRVGPIERLIPFVGLQGGPTLVFTTGGPQNTREEHLTQGFAGSVGATALFGTLGVTLEARYVLAYGTAAPVGVLNAGGLWAGLGFTWTVPPSAKDSALGGSRF